MNNTRTYILHIQLYDTTNGEAIGKIQVSTLSHFFPFIVHLFILFCIILSPMIPLQWAAHESLAKESRISKQLRSACN